MADDLTPVEHRRIQSSRRIEETPAERIAYQHTVLCQTALPYRDPGDQVRVWERQQGAASLRLEAGAAWDARTSKYVDLGLPYGPKPRLILAYLNLEALRTGSPEIEVEKSLTAFVKRIGLFGHGRDVRAVKDQLMRLAAAQIRMTVAYGAEHVQQVQAHVVSGFDLWFPKDEHQRVLWPTVVRLSLDYFVSLQRHAVPLDERALAALAHSAMALDVYAWLAQRLRRVEPGRPQRITWQALHDQFGHGFVRVRKFRETFLDVLALVLIQYRAAKVEADEAGLALRNSPPPVAARLVPVPKLLE